MSVHGGSLSHTRAVTLMPAFICGVLDSQRQRQMQEHIATCSSCATLHRGELEVAGLVRQTPVKVEALLTSDRRERNRRLLLQLIAAGTPAKAGGTSSAPTLTHPLKRRFRVHFPMRTAGLAAVLVCGLFFVSGQEPALNYRPVTYQTRTAASTAPEVAGPLYRVVFRASVTQPEVQQLLHDLDAVLVGGPSEAGVYSVTFPSRGEDPDTLLEHLRQRPEIALVERAVHRD